MKKRFFSYLKRIGPGGLVVRAFLLWFILAFLLFPTLNLLYEIFFSSGGFSSDVVMKLIHSKRAMRSLSNSFILAVTLVVTVNVVGTALVLFTEYFDIKGSGLLRLGYMSTLVYGGVVLCTGYKFIYGPNGIITRGLLGFFPALDPNWFTGYFAVVFIMTFACTSNHMIFLTNAIRGIDYQTVEASQNMGASPFKTFFKVILPVLKPSFFAVTILTFLTGLGAMSAPLMVGGSEFQTINPMIVTFANSSHSRNIASLLACVLGLATMVLLAIMNRLEANGNYMSISKVKSTLVKQRIRSPIANVAAHAVAYLLFLIYVTPMLLVVMYSFTDSKTILSGKISLSSFTLDNYKQLFTAAEAFKPYIISLIYALTAAAIVALLVVVVSRILHKSRSPLTKTLEYAMLIPWLLPSTLIALGLMSAYGSARPIMANKVLVGTPFILLAAYVIVKIPFSLRMVKASFFSVDGALEDASRSMGASSLRTMLKVILPIVFPSILAVVVLNFNSLIAEYDMTLFLYHPLLKPLGPVIKAASDDMASVNAKAMSFVYSVVLMIISTFALFLVYGKKPKRHKHG